MKNLFSKTGMMLLSLLKRDWLKLIIWASGFIILAGGLAGPMYEIYGKDETGLIGLYETMKNPAMIALVGPTAASVEEYTAAMMFAQEMILVASVIFAIIAVMHVVSRSRSEEEAGTLELFLSFQVGRLANTTAVVIEMLLLHVGMTFATAAVILVQDIPQFQSFNGNLLFAASMASQGFLWSVVGLIFAQLCGSASSARGFSFSLMGLLYILRMGSDMENINLSRLNPLSWCYLTEAFVNNHWQPILYTLLLSAALLVVVYALEQARDVGSGYLPEGGGKVHAKKSLLSLPGLTFRLQRSYTFAWLSGLFILGIMYGSIFGDIDKFVEDSEVMQIMFLHNQDYSLAEQFMSTLFLIFSIMSAAFAVMSLNKLVTEEKKQRLEQLYAVKNSRRAFYLIYLGFALLCGILGQFFGALGLFVSEMVVMEEPIPFWEVMKAGMVWTPVIVFFIGIAAVLVGLMPRLIQVTWGYLLYCFFIGYVGQLLDIPEVLKELNILSHIPQLPADEMTWGSILVICGASVVLLVIGYFGYRSRDLISD